MLDDTFTALSDPARRKLVRRLAQQPQTAGMLAEPFAISRPAVSRHLRVLREAGLVRVTARGRERWYTLDPDGLAGAQQWLEEVQEMWAEALQALKEYVEADNEHNDRR